MYKKKKKKKKKFKRKKRKEFYLFVTDCTYSTNILYKKYIKSKKISCKTNRNICRSRDDIS